jgi:hypothetical protein
VNQVKARYDSILAVLVFLCYVLLSALAVVVVALPADVAYMVDM